MKHECLSEKIKSTRVVLNGQTSSVGEGIVAIGNRYIHTADDHCEFSDQSNFRPNFV